MVVAVAAAFSLTSCSAANISEEGSTAGIGTSIAVVLTDSGCSAKPAEAPSGIVTFKITSTGNGSISELELQSKGRILAEKENIAPGLTASFDITLKPGAYELYCPGGSGQQTQKFIVTSAADAPSSTPSLTP